MFLFNRFVQGFVNTGTLTVIEPGGKCCSYGDGEPHAAIRIHDSSWPLRVAIRPELAVGEGYMNGAFTLEQGDLPTFLELCSRNTVRNSRRWMPRAMALLERAGKRLYQLNPISRARRNVAHHYELSVDFFDTFLDSQRQYSCGYFVNVDDDLETAQQQKMRHIAAKLCLQPGMTVLDIGCGWGGLALYLARNCGVRVTGVTLSKEQFLFASQQARRRGLAGQVEFRLQDYRHINEQYDRIVSVGMFEHVGSTHYSRFFGQLERALQPDGVALLHSIGRAGGPGVTNAWTRKWIFPGGYSPALSEVIPCVERMNFYITDLEILRLHYAETTRRWLQRFTARREEVVSMYDERFCRMWEFYLAAAEASFRWGEMMVFQLQLARNINAVPVTRDYIGLREQALQQSPRLPLVASLDRFRN